MVRKSQLRYTIADWRKDNPVEAGIMDLISAAKAYASSQAPHVGRASDDPEDVPQRFDDEATLLELSIHRGEVAIRAMMETSQGRKAAGLKKRARGRDKSYDPAATLLSDPQVQIVLKMLRGEMEQEEAFAQVATMIAPRGEIDHRTLKIYVAELIRLWGLHSDPNLPSLLVRGTEP
jgi:hypothetical protein